MLLVAYLWLKFLFWVILLPLWPIVWLFGIKRGGLLVATIMIIGLVHEPDIVGRFNRAVERHEQAKGRAAGEARRDQARAPKRALDRSDAPRGGRLSLAPAVQSEEVRRREEAAARRARA